MSMRPAGYVRHRRTGASAYEVSYTLTEGPSEIGTTSEPIYTLSEVMRALKSGVVFRAIGDELRLDLQEKLKILNRITEALTP